MKAETPEAIREMFNALADEYPRIREQARFVADVLAAVPASRASAETVARTMRINAERVERLEFEALCRGEITIQ